MPRARFTPRRFGWPFARRGNRRVKLASTVPGGALLRGVASSVKRGGRAWLFALVIAVGIAATAGAAYYVTRSPSFAVRTLKFSPTQHVSAQALEARLGSVIGMNLFRVDLDDVARELLQEPWLASVHARRELPQSLSIEVVEREAACVVAFGTLYLADARGFVFKRATPAEATSLPVVTGVDRERYLSDPEGARADVRRALELLPSWRSGDRPAVREIHLDHFGATLYLDGGVGVRVGRADETLPARWLRFDAVKLALARAGLRPQLIHLENRARPDRVTVKLKAGPRVHG